MGSPSLGCRVLGTLVQGWPGRAAQLWEVGWGMAGWLGEASSLSCVMPTALGAGCCDSKAGGVLQVLQRQCQTWLGGTAWGPPECPIPKGGLVSMLGWGAGTCPPQLLGINGAGSMPEGRLVGWVGTVLSPTPHLVPPPAPRSPSSAVEKDFNYLSGKTTIRENNSFLLPHLRLTVLG